MTNDLSCRDKADLTVRASVLALSRAQDISVPQMCAAAGIRRSTLYTRLRSNSPVPFLAREVAGLAALFHVSVQALYDGVRVETTWSTGPSSFDGVQLPLQHAAAIAG